MPELPEVETMVRGVRGALQGRELLDLAPCRCRCRPLEIKPGLRSLRKRVRGRRIEAVDRLAKRIVIGFDTGDRLVIEPRMTGLMLIEDPPDPAYLRLEFRLGGEGPEAVWLWDRRGLGTVTLYSPAEWERWRSEKPVGPDALELSRGDWSRILGSVDRELKVALLDQKLIAGIGNLYASEILHRARLHPARRTPTLSGDEVSRLHRANRRVLSDAIRYEGSTLADGTYRNALNRSGGYQNRHRVYARAGETCPDCGASEIVRIVQAQRSTFFCPRCQPDV